LPINMMKTWVVLIELLAIALVACADKSQFESWMRKYNKVYTQSEFSLKYATFMENIAIIDAQNALQDGLVYGLNQYSDMNSKEFREIVLMKETIQVKKGRSRPFVPAVDAPPAFDWRSQKAVTAVKDQGQCGSCWAFSATETIESAWLISGKATQDNLNLAPQQIVDCDKVDAGCGGGWPEQAMAYVIAAGGLEGASHYPYMAKDGSCKYNQTYIEARISKYLSATKKRDETALQSNLANLGPLSVCVDANNWQHYQSGVMTHTKCCIFCSLDHAVQLVGYNTTANPAYWIVRNSWGADWGVDGYIHLQIGDNPCGITDHVYWPNL